MQTETKKAILFGVIITFFTSAYAAFLNTAMKEGMVAGHFFSDWVTLFPKTYLFLLPYVLVTGRITKKIVERIFRSADPSKQQ